MDKWAPRESQDAVPDLSHFSTNAEHQVGRWDVVLKTEGSSKGGSENGMREELHVTVNEAVLSASSSTKNHTWHVNSIATYMP